jgi:hypothetical protein
MQHENKASFYSSRSLHGPMCLSPVRTSARNWLANGFGGTEKGGIVSVRMWSGQNPVDVPCPAAVWALSCWLQVVSLSGAQDCWEMAPVWHELWYLITTSPTMHFSASGPLSLKSCIETYAWYSGGICLRFFDPEGVGWGNSRKTQTMGICLENSVDILEWPGGGGALSELCLKGYDTRFQSHADDIILTTFQGTSPNFHIWYQHFSVASQR